MTWVISFVAVVLCFGVVIGIVKLLKDPLWEKIFGIAFGILAVALLVYMVHLILYGAVKP